ncbi:TetR/AcrR family transcriptional regulator [Peptococcaceae bacterium]|nr:TetR/AcrR family transcriptional regulator [Peptococcaceae bacterium]
MKKFIKKSREERIEEILRAAVCVFLEKGYRNATMEDIIAKTSLSKGGFYYYFKNTKEIFLAVMERYGKINIEEIKKMLDESLDKESFFKELADFLFNRILKETDEKKIYIMAVSELFYDGDYIHRLRDMRNAYIEAAIKYCCEKFKLNREEIKRKLELLAEVFESLSIGCYLFKKEKFYVDQEDNVKKLLFDIIK